MTEDKKYRMFYVVAANDRIEDGLNDMWPGDSVVSIVTDREKAVNDARFYEFLCNRPEYDIYEQDEGQPFTAARIMRYALPAHSKDYVCCLAEAEGYDDPSDIAGDLLNTDKTRYYRCPELDAYSNMEEQCGNSLWELLMAGDVKTDKPKFSQRAIESYGLWGKYESYEQLVKPVQKPTDKAKDSEDNSK